MTPTPDRTEPPPAATLTAEQIAAIRAHYNKMTSGLASWELYDIPALIASHAALRDRLARAEARITELTDLLREAHGHLSIGLNVYDEISGALATPTDGAARDAGAAGDGGGAT